MNGSEKIFEPRQSHFSKVSYCDIAACSDNGGSSAILHKPLCKSVKVGEKE